MPSSSQSIQETLSNLAGSWASYTALGTFLLYVFGYLSLRFHLTALGIPTDLTVVDQRYFYAGAKFLVYILGYIPIIVLVTLVLLIVLTTILFVLSGVVTLFNWRRRSDGTDLTERLRGRFWQLLTGWLNNVSIVALVGIVVAEVWIQVLMRQCFTIHDALLDPSVTNVSWVGTIIRSENNRMEVLFFSTIVAGTIVVAWLLFTAVRLRKKLATEAMLDARDDKNTLATALIALLAVLFVIQLLLLPVNHGVLIADKGLPRLKDLGQTEKLEGNYTAWLVWEGSQGVTYLVQREVWDAENQGPVRVRSLITVPRESVKRTEVIANDPINELLRVSISRP